MARGWESKSIEDQQAEAATAVDKNRVQLTPEQLTRKRERDLVLLTRLRILHQLEDTQPSQRREMLENALSEIDARLAKLG
jgi:hypothetical protein